MATLKFLSFVFKVLVVDEISQKSDVETIKSMSNRGVITIGTAHAYDLKSLLKNDELNGLVGGLKDVTIGD